MKTKQSSFTLMEIVVAIAILAIVFSFAGVVFKVSIGAFRTAVANAEIMRKLRAITNQLNIDFKGVRKDMPIVIWPDRIVFLSNGDFQSIQQYPYEDPNGDIFSKTIRGNLASIFYGITDVVIGKDEEGNNILGKPILSRGQMILTYDDSLLNNPNPLELGEYCQISFYEFKTEWKNIFGDKETWAGKNLLPLDIYKRERNLARYMIDDINDFTIECAMWKSGLVWQKRNGVFINSSTNALKFSFTLYDSNGIIENGRRFTHIVYIGD